LTKIAFATAIVLAIVSPALAQGVVETPAGGAVAVPAPGAPGVLTQQPGSTGSVPAVTYSPTGSAADSVATDSAAAGNEGQPSRVGSTGSGGSK
jgi:hypothetical protein